MGNQLSCFTNLKTKFDNSFKPEKEFSLKRIYWDSDGNLRHGVSDRNRDEEVIKLLEADTFEDPNEDKIWMIVPSRWIRLWLQFSYFKVGEPPGPITMHTLVVEDKTAPSGYRVKKTLLPPSTEAGQETPGHYRRISYEAWLLLVDFYKVVGPAIAVYGSPYDDRARWGVFKDPRNINKDVLPPPPPKPTKEEKDEADKKNKKGLLGSGLRSLFSADPEPNPTAKKAT